MNTKTEPPLVLDPELDWLLRELRSNEAWFEASHAWLAADEPETANREPGTANREPAAQPRPLSLASLDALRLMGLDFSAGVFDTPEIALYRWLHTAPLPRVKAALWSGEWRFLLGNPEPLAENVVAAFRAEQARLVAIITAVTVTLRPRPRPKKDDTPPDVIKPALATYRACTIAAALRADLEQVRWHLPLVQALQVYHWALWEAGGWTVRPGKVATVEELGDLMPEE